MTTAPPPLGSDHDSPVEVVGGEDIDCGVHALPGLPKALIIEPLRVAVGGVRKHLPSHGTFSRMEGTRPAPMTQRK